MPSAEITGIATVNEQRPKPDRSFTTAHFNSVSIGFCIRDILSDAAIDIFIIQDFLQNKKGHFLQNLSLWRGKCGRIKGNKRRSQEEQALELYQTEIFEVSEVIFR